MEFLQGIDYNNIDNGINYLKTNQFKFFLPKEEKTIYHVYWYGMIKRKQLCCINSYLATQDLSNTELWVWLDENTFNNSNKELIKDHKNIKIKKYCPNKEKLDTPFYNYKFVDQTKSLKFRSDIARIIFLYKYGGLYYDLDMILLKDLKPLLNKEFCYTWSYIKRGNNGILRLKKQSELCYQLMNKYKNTISPFNLHNEKFFLGYNHKYIFTEEIKIMCFPCVMFDPVWILMDTKSKSKYSKLSHLDDFFKSTDEDINKFFDNQIFTYHWHSRANVVIQKDSYFEKIEKLLKKKLMC